MDIKQTSIFDHDGMTENERRALALILEKFAQAQRMYEMRDAKLADKLIIKIGQAIDKYPALASGFLKATALRYATPKSGVATQDAVGEGSA